MQVCQETVKRKLNSVEILENEELEIYRVPNDIANVINEGMGFEIEKNTRLNTLEKFQNHHAKDAKPKTSNLCQRPELNNVKLHFNSI